MFTSFNSYEVSILMQEGILFIVRTSILIKAIQSRRDVLAQQAVRSVPTLASRLRTESEQLRELELRLSNEQAKHETTPESLGSIAAREQTP